LSNEGVIEKAGSELGIAGDGDVDKAAADGGTGIDVAEGVGGADVAGAVEEGDVDDELGCASGVTVASVEGAVCGFVVGRASCLLSDCSK